ncbi:MAG: prenyltransferase [Candidatus Omnitrophica bacterium]|nr:prenyltransferase [Candidatus Omnitrophota bacterium]MCF7887891.1 prenyltransferase [Candidatus Omnitrophota bacterium]
MGLTNKIKVYIRAFRLPFLVASIFPFVFGSFYPQQFSLIVFFGGIVCVVFTHLGANLINDYADSKTGLDWKDTKFYGFFGGSKLIQEGVLSESFYLNRAVVCFLIALLSVFFLAVKLASVKIVIYYFLIIFLGFSYSHKPFQFCYHFLGELVIFILFGPAIVMGAYFLQTGLFPCLKSFILSLPFGFFTTAILVANEVPDYKEDNLFNKFNLIKLISLKKSYFLYLVLNSLGFISILIAYFLGLLPFFSLISLSSFFLILKAALIIKNDFTLKNELIKSSQLTILNQVLVSLILILSIKFI